MLWIDFWVTFTAQSQRLRSYEPNRLTLSLQSVECCAGPTLQGVNILGKAPVWTVEGSREGALASSMG